MGGQPPGSFLDQPFLTTFFRNYAAQTKTPATVTLRSLAPRVRTVSAATKNGLPWLKLAEFGDEKTPKGSLRHDTNVVQITGVEGDYDLEQMPVPEAVKKLEQARIAAMVYTSPSHTEDTPRWRVLCPTSVALPPQSATVCSPVSMACSGACSPVKAGPSHSRIITAPLTRTRPTTFS